MAAKADIEMRWVNAWNELYEFVGASRDVPCQLPDSSVVDIEHCKRWLQKSVYEGFEVEVKAGWVGHKRGVVVSSSWPENEPKSSGGI